MNGFFYNPYGEQPKIPNDDIIHTDEDMQFQAFAGIVAGCAVYLVGGVLALCLCLIFGF